MFPATHSNRNILIIEEDSESAELLWQILVAEGYHVFIANGSTRAQEYLQQNLTFDLIMIEPNMPCGDGWELLADIRHYPYHSQTPIVVVSNNNNGEQRAACLGADTYLAKPLDIDLLLDTICLLTTTISV